MIAPPVTPSRAALAWLVGCLVAAGVLVVFPPGRYDVAPLRLSGTSAIDEGYWSAPLARREGAGGLEPYDHGLAISLALPQNVLGVAARTLGAPLETARWAGSIAAAIVLGALAVAFGGLRGVALACLLANPFVFGHIASDLGEAPALAIVAAWVWATARGRLGLAGALAAVGLFQKGCGLFLGVGCIAGALAGGAGRLPRISRAALGVAVGLLLSIVAAWALFGDSPWEFVLRPWRTTGEVRPLPGVTDAHAWGGHLVQMLFAGHHGAGPRLALPLLAALLLASRSRPGTAVLAALVAALLYYGLFPDPQRLLPLVPLLVLPALDPAHENPSRAGLFLALLLVPQAVGSAMKAVGWTPGALGLGIVSLGLAVALAAAARVRWPAPRVAAGVAAVALFASAILGPIVARADERLFTTDLHDLAGVIAHRLPSDANVQSYAVVGTRFRGTVWYADFRGHSEGELARARPARLYRVRAEPTSGPRRGPSGGPAGYQLASSESLGTWPYSHDGHPVEVWLDELRPPP